MCVWWFLHSFVHLIVLYTLGVYHIVCHSEGKGSVSVSCASWEACLWGHGCQPAGVCPSASLCVPHGGFLWKKVCLDSLDTYENESSAKFLYGDTIASLTKISVILL